MADNYAVSGCGLFTIWLKEQEMPIGVSTLSKRDYLEEVDLGYALLPEYEGFGYAYEASKAILDYALMALKFKNIAAITLKNHTKSIHLLEKLGFRFKRNFRESGDEMIEMEFKSIE
jgi:RimJ/RimL family protein N-acetyltransferase